MNNIDIRMKTLLDLKIPSLVQIDERTASMRINSNWDVKITIQEKKIIYEARSKGKTYDIEKDIGVPDDVKTVIEGLKGKYTPALLALMDDETDYSEQEKDPINNLKDSGFEIVDAPKIESFEEPDVIKKDNWSVGRPNARVKRLNPDELEPANLPAPVGVGIVRPAVTAAEALAAWKEFQELKNYIIERSDIQVIQGKNHIKKSGWRKFATFYNLTDQIVEETQIPLEKGGFYWKIKVVCTAPNGRQTEGVGMCASGEKSGARLLHDVYSTAHTRAKNRAISDMIAAGEVSAEEMEA